LEATTMRQASAVLFLVAAGACALPCAARAPSPGALDRWQREARDVTIYQDARKAPAFMPEMDSATARRLDAAAAV
jgi:hypothetical protein